MLTGHDLLWHEVKFHSFIFVQPWHLVQRKALSLDLNEKINHLQLLSLWDWLVLILLTSFICCAVFRRDRVSVAEGETAATWGYTGYAGPYDFNWLRSKPHGAVSSKFCSQGKISSLKRRWVKPNVVWVG